MKSLFVLLFLVSCGQDYQFAKMTVGDSEETSYSSGSGVYEILVDRSATPWSSNNNVTADRDGVVYLPDSFKIPSMSNTDNGGWFDFVIGKEVYCYQGKFGTKTFEFSYKKSDGATLGCDSNSEKSSEAFSMYVAFKEGDNIQVIPRAPRYDVVEEFSFPFVGITKE